jgi:type IV pilus assembly protein PilX
MNANTPDSHRQQGIALVFALVFLLLMTLIALAAIQTTSLDERMAGNSRDRNIAFQAAETALRSAETLLEGATLPSFNNVARPGLRQPILSTEIGALDIDTFWMDAYCWTIRTGCTSALSQETPTLEGVNGPPRYVIEELPRVEIPGASVKFGPQPDFGLYRLTARSVGGTTDAVVMLQAVFRR